MSTTSEETVKPEDGNTNDPSTWRLVENSDLAEAKVDHCDPSKFWLHVETIHMPKKAKWIEFCDKVSLGGVDFDWRSQDHIDALNDRRKLAIEAFGSRVPEAITEKVEASKEGVPDFAWETYLAEGNGPLIDAMVNNPDPSKFSTIFLKCYAPGFDWSRQDHVDALNATRCQALAKYGPEPPKGLRGRPSAAGISKIQSQASKPSENVTWSNRQVTCIRLSEWRFVRGSDLSDARTNEADAFKMQLEVENTRQPRTRFRYDSCAEDVPTYGRPYFDWTKKDHIEFLNACRKQVIWLYFGRVVGIPILEEGLVSPTQPRSPITIPREYTIQQEVSEATQYQVIKSAQAGAGSIPGSVPRSTEQITDLTSRPKQVALRPDAPPFVARQTRFPPARLPPFVLHSLLTSSSPITESAPHTTDSADSPTSPLPDLVSALPSTVPPFFTPSRQISESAIFHFTNSPAATAESVSDEHSDDLLPHERGVPTPGVGGQPAQ